MKKVKRITALLMTAFIMTAPIAALADTQDTSVMYTTSSEGSLPATYSGNSNNIISMKNPQTLITSTTTKSYVISAVAQTGTVVSLYSYNASTDKYDKMLTEDGVLMQSTVGASGLYAQSVNLNSGKNNIMIVAVNGTNTEVIKLDITLNQGIVAKIIGFGSELSQIFR
ncbi:MAG: hypothetical protein IJ365_07520 [Clostridia bacterium]|nr:hypothetical protein [Clostridia bacterium]